MSWSIMWLINNYWMRFFVISRIIKGEVSVISRSRRPSLITLTETLIILDNTKNRIQWLFYYTLKVSNKIQNSNEEHSTSESFIKVLKLSFPWGAPGTLVYALADFSAFSASLSSTNISVSRSIDWPIRAIVYRSLSASYATAQTTWQITPAALRPRWPHDKISRIICSSRNRDWDLNV